MLKENSDTYTLLAIIASVFTSYNSGVLEMFLEENNSPKFIMQSEFKSEVIIYSSYQLNLGLLSRLLNLVFKSSKCDNEFVYSASLLEVHRLRIKSLTGFFLISKLGMKTASLQALLKDENLYQDRLKEHTNELGEFFQRYVD